MPRLWVSTIEAHRREVQNAILTTTAALVAERGLTAVTMSQIAEETGIGRATLYKYFPDVAAILDAWHQQHVARHLERLRGVRDRHDGPASALRAVLEEYALIAFERTRAEHHITHHASPRRSPGHAHDQRRRSEAAHGRHATDVTALVHRTEHVADVQRRLTSFLAAVLRDAAESGEIRRDVDAIELASYCLHALGAAGTLRTKVAIPRLVELTLAGLQPRRRTT